MPFLPNSPTTSPFFGVGSRYSRKEFLPYWWILSVPSSVARFTMVIASNGHTLTQIPHPLQMFSSICAFFISSFSMMQSAPDLLTGQYLMHSRPHFFGWHNSLSNTATRCVMVYSLARSIYTSFGCGRNLNTEQSDQDFQAGHSVRARPSLFPNLEVKPNVATVLLRCESPWEVVVLASFNQIIIV